MKKWNRYKYLRWTRYILFVYFFVVFSFLGVFLDAFFCVISGCFFLCVVLFCCCFPDRLTDGDFGVSHYWRLRSLLLLVGAVISEWLLFLCFWDPGDVSVAFRGRSSWKCPDVSRGNFSLVWGEFSSVPNICWCSSEMKFIRMRLPTWTKTSLSGRHSTPPAHFPRCEI